MARKVIIELQVLPPISTMSLLTRSDTIILEGHETYQKRSYRNRILIADAQGKRVISIPLVKGKHEQQSIREVKISYDTAWDTSLTKLIKAAYGSAPYFEYYYDDIVDIIQKGHTYLWELSYDLLEYVLKCIGCGTEMIISGQFLRDYDDDFYDARGHFLPTREVHLTPTYDQVFMERHGFIGDLSILDMLMCCGPETSIRISDLEDQF